MSVISRQSFKYSLIGYLGSLLGIFASIFIYPHNYEYYGKLRYIISIAETIFPFVVIGISYSNIKFYYELKQKNKHHNLLSFSFLFISFFGLILFILLNFIDNIYPNITKLTFWKYRYIIFILVIIFSFSNLISKYLTNLKRIAIPGILESFLPKIGLLTTFILFVFLSYSELFSETIFLSFYIISLICFIIYLLKLDSFKFNFDFSFIKENKFYVLLFNYSIFSLLGSIGSMLAFRIDSTMIVEFIDEKSNGIYATLLSMISILTIPTIGVYSISSPLIREYLVKNDYEKLRNLYKNTSFFLLLIGSFIFCLLFSTMDSLFGLMKNGKVLLENKEIIYIIGFSTLIDLATGFNSHIITMSNYYRYTIYFMLILSVLTITSNLILINYTSLGIIGVSIATALSLTIYNIVKIIFNFKKFKVQPFSLEMYKVLFLVFICLIISCLIPKFTNLWINLFLNPFLVLIIFLVGNYFFGFVPIDSVKNLNLKSIITGKND